jgi:hypothetical protein
MKPPIWEGNIFVGNYEGATEVAYGEPHVDGREAMIGVDLVSVMTNFTRGDRRRSVFWRDRVKLRKEKRGWLVADVIRNESGSLTDELRKYVNDEGRECREQAMKQAHQANSAK